MKQIYYILIINVFIDLFGCSSQSLYDAKPIEITLEKTQIAANFVADSLSKQALAKYPFNPETYYLFRVTRSDSVNIQIFDLIGRSVTRGFVSALKQGNYQINLKSII